MTPYFRSVHCENIGSSLGPELASLPYLIQFPAYSDAGEQTRLGVHINPLHPSTFYDRR